MSQQLPDTLSETLVITLEVQDRGVGLAHAMLSSAAHNNLLMMLTGPSPLDGTNDHIVIRPLHVEVKP